VREPYVQRAENVAAREDFYAVHISPFVGDEPGSRPSAIDDLWSSSEQMLGALIDAARGATTTSLMPARAYAAFVDFLAQLLARTPDFDRRFVARFSGATDDLLELVSNRDNVNAVRTIEIQRLRPAFLYGRWHFVTFPASSLVLNDRGYAGTGDNITGATGLCFPLAHDLAVTVLSSTEPVDLIELDGAFYVALGATRFSASDATSLGTLVVAWAPEEIYGPSREVVAAASIGFQDDANLFGPELVFGHSGEWLHEHETDYFRFLGQIGEPPS
jgi:hypothetical protein